MRLIKKLFCVLSICAISSFALAVASKDSVVNLTVPNNGLVNPNGGILSVSLSTLVTNVAYNVTCHVTDPNLPKSIAFKFRIDGSNGPSAITYSVNGVSTNAYGQADLSGADNIVTAQNVIPNTNMGTPAYVFQNLDTTASATVSNCSAVPVTK